MYVYVGSRILSTIFRVGKGKCKEKSSQSKTKTVILRKETLLANLVFGWCLRT